MPHQVVVQFGKGLKDPTIPFEVLHESLQEVLKILKNPDNENSAPLTRFTLANAVVLLDKTQFESVDQIETLASEFETVGQDRKRKIAPHYGTCLDIARYLRGYLTPLNELTEISMPDVHHQREVFLRERATMAIGALEVIRTSKEELAKLKSSKVDEGEGKQSIIKKDPIGQLNLLITLYDVLKRKRSNVPKTHVATDRENREVELRHAIQLSEATYSASEIKPFLLSFGHKKENFELVKKFFHLVDPDHPYSSFSKSTHLKLLIETSHAISKKNIEHLENTQESNDYLKHLCNLGISWLESEKDVPDQLKFAKQLRKIAVRITLDVEDSEKLITMSRGFSQNEKIPVNA